MVGISKHVWEAKKGGGPFGDGKQKEVKPPTKRSQNIGLCSSSSHFTFKVGSSEAFP